MKTLYILVFTDLMKPNQSEFIPRVVSAVTSNLLPTGQNVISLDSRHRYANSNIQNSQLIYSLPLLKQVVYDLDFYLYRSI